MRGKQIKIGSLLFLFIASGGYAKSSDAWQIDVAPYLWAINLNGHVQVGHTNLSVSQSFGDILRDFQGGGMLWLNARKNKFSVFTNLMYSVLRQHQTIDTINISAKNHFGIFSAGAAYEVFQKVNTNQVSQLSVELLGGARYTLNDTTLNVGPFSVADNKNWTDPMFGTRITYDFNKKWQAIFVGDGGGINDHYSYDLQGYIGYKPTRPLLFENMTLYLGYRLLHQKYTTGSGSSLYVWNMNISGPLIGAKTTF
jgi:hypothetical protein